jgi:uncharacterized membrane protein
VTSFVAIGILWMNHHAVLRMIRSANRPLTRLNLVFLMLVVAVPSAT